MKQPVLPQSYKIRPAARGDAAVIAHHRVEMFRGAGPILRPESMLQRFRRNGPSRHGQDEDDPEDVRDPRQQEAGAG